jgi:hypothetical protein
MLRLLASWIASKSRPDVWWLRRGGVLRWVRGWYLQLTYLPAVLSELPPDFTTAQ